MKLQHLRAVVFDWAGTVIDFGSQAPMDAFVRLFAEEGVTISAEEARVPMGLPKWHHIEVLGRLPRVAAAWRAAKGRDMTAADVDRLYAIYTPMNAAAVHDHARLVPGAAEVVARLRAAGLRIGSTTGYSRPIAQVVADLAAQQGFAPDNMVCADDLAETRPSPMAMYRCFLALQVWPAAAVVKVDDTLPGLLEGRHAGCWTVGVLASGNGVGLSAEAWAALPEAERATRRERAAIGLGQAQPDYLIDTVADLPPIIATLEARLAAGERPAPMRLP
jgi:phosphonoacetaldehyde hydrolase